MDLAGHGGVRTVGCCAGQARTAHLKFTDANELLPTEMLTHAAVLLAVLVAYSRDGSAEMKQTLPAL